MEVTLVNQLSKDKLNLIQQCLILEELIEEKEKPLSKLLSQQNLNIIYDKDYKVNIYKDHQINEKISQQQQQETYDIYLEKFNIDKDDDKVDEEDRESNWTEATNQDQDNDVICLDDNIINEMDQSDNENENGEDNIPQQQLEEEKKLEDSINKEGDKNIQEIENDESQFKFDAHKDFATRLHINPINQNQFVSGGGDDVAIIWDFTNTKEPIKILPKESETIDCVKFNFDGSLLAIGALNGVVKIYETKSWTMKHLLEGPTDEIRFLDWHQKGNALVAGSADNSAWMWNANNGQYMMAFYGHEQSLSCGGFIPNGTKIATLSEDASVRIWNPKDGSMQFKIQGFGFHEDAITCFNFHHSQQIMVTGSVDSTVCISNYGNGKILGRTNDLGSGVENVLFVSTMDLFLTGTLNGQCQIMDMQKLTVRDKINLNHAITKLVEIKERHLIAGSTSKGRIYLFDYRQPNKQICLLGGGSMIQDLIQYKNDGLLASYDDGKIRYFDITKLQYQQNVLNNF